jgi:hypothetical protein
LKQPNSSKEHMCHTRTNNSLRETEISNINNNTLSYCFIIQLMKRNDKYKLIGKVFEFLVILKTLHTEVLTDWVYSHPPKSTGDMFQHHQWKLQIISSPVFVPIHPHV